MKKLILMVGVLMVAVVLMAAGKVSYKDGIAELQRLINVEKNYVAAQAYLDNIDCSGSEANKGSYVSLQVTLDICTKKAILSIADTKTYVSTLATKVGLTDQTLIDYAILRAICTSDRPNYNEECYTFYKSIAKPNKECKSFMANITSRLKKYDECIALNLEIGNYLGASRVANQLKDKVKTFEYSKKAILGLPVSAVVLSEVLTKLSNIDFSDTPITKAMQIDLLQSVNAKYSRFLITNKTEWEPIIANVRTTLEGYGAK